jgi:hypothetical protein
MGLFSSQGYIYIHRSGKKVPHTHKNLKKKGEKNPQGYEDEEIFMKKEERTGEVLFAEFVKLDNAYYADLSGVRLTLDLKDKFCTP